MGSSAMVAMFYFSDGGDTLTVRNNIQPRITAQASTGTGLKNIRQQYLDICNRPISVEKTQSEFIVNIPLL